MTPPRRLIERAFVLALTAFLLWVPPLVGVFSLNAMFLGLPVLFLYFFASWGILIAGCVILSRSLRQVAQTDGRQ
ncbi:hypothetical protein LPB41_22535 [Thalassospira sp. MA62]|nr:hypothetical protein [Thalassospira sp. MA62]